MKMGDFNVPDNATHFIPETDEYREHFIQADSVGNVIAEFVPELSYIGWDFDIEPYPMVNSSVPVPAYNEFKTIRQQNSVLVEALREAKLALESSYDVTDYPGGLLSNQGCVANDIGELLTRLDGKK